MFSRVARLVKHTFRHKSKHYATPAVAEQTHDEIHALIDDSREFLSHLYQALVAQLDLTHLLEDSAAIRAKIAKLSNTTLSESFSAERSPGTWTLPQLQTHKDHIQKLIDALDLLLIVAAESGSPVRAASTLRADTTQCVHAALGDMKSSLTDLRATCTLIMSWLTSFEAAFRS